MKVTETTRQMLRRRRAERLLKLDGFEPVSDDGSPLWELRRGDRQDHAVTDTRIGPDKKTVWVRIQRIIPEAENYRNTIDILLARIARLQGELEKYDGPTNNMLVAKLKHDAEIYRRQVNFLNEGFLEAQTTIASQQALLIALVECKDTLLERMYQAENLASSVRHSENWLRKELAKERLINQITSYPAKATPGMVKALEDTASFCRNYTDDGTELRNSDEMLEAALAAAPPDDRDARIAELERQLVNAQPIADSWAAHHSEKSEKLTLCEKERDELKLRISNLIELELTPTQAALDLMTQERDELKQRLDDAKYGFGPTELECVVIEAAVAVVRDVWAKHMRPSSFLYDDTRKLWEATEALIAARKPKTLEGQGLSEAQIAKVKDPFAATDALWASKAAPVDKTKLAGYGLCAACYSELDNSLSSPCFRCKHSTGETEDNWTPKEGA